MGEDARSPGGRAKSTQPAWTTLVSLVAFVLAGLFIFYLVIPGTTFVFPGLRSFYYDLAIYGVYPERSYVSFNLTSPDLSITKSGPSIKDGVVFLGIGGQSVSTGGPTILDMEGNLIWTSDQFPNAMNVQTQRFHGQEYLTFWSGEKLQESGLGSCYMLTRSYEIAHIIDAVGSGLRADMHECKITADDTALIIAYEEVTSASKRSSHLDDTDLVDGRIQEIDIETGELLFEWRASDHVDYALGYMSDSSGEYQADGYLDYFHMNSVDKGSDGNYLVSIRHSHQILCIDGLSGDILWALGGTSQDFEDLSEGSATSFMWQHDARWVSEEEGIISVFDNGRARKHHDRSYSQGLLIQLDFDDWTATLLQDFHSLDSISSASQGNVQTIDGKDNETHHFIGWGSSAAFSEHSDSGDVLYEAHYGAALLYWFERVKSYRVFKAPQWSALPYWDPSARLKGNKIYVSWNGATVVRRWVLQGRRPRPPGEEESEAVMDVDDEWEAITTIDKGAAFECSLDLPRGDAYVVYQVVALDEHSNSLTHSNVLPSRPQRTHKLEMISLALLIASGAVLVGIAMYLLWLRLLRLREQRYELVQQEMEIVK